jgi:hypothetical protein
MAEKDVDGNGQVVRCNECYTTNPITAKEKGLNRRRELLLSNLMSESEAKIEEATQGKQHSGGLKIFSAKREHVSCTRDHRHLGVNGKATVGRFADGEVNVAVQENVRGKDVYVVQPTGPPVMTTLWNFSHGFDV